MILIVVFSSDIVNDSVKVISSMGFLVNILFVLDVFKVYNKDMGVTSDVVFLSLLLTLNSFHASQLSK